MTNQNNFVLTTNSFNGRFFDKCNGRFVQHTYDFHGMSKNRQRNQQLCRRKTSQTDHFAQIDNCCYLESRLHPLLFFGAHHFLKHIDQ